MTEGSTLQENLIPDVCVPTTVRLKFLQIHDAKADRAKTRNRN